MSTIEVWEDGAYRPARPRELASSQRILSLLGFEVEQGEAVTSAPLGDALVSIASALGIRREERVLVCAEVASDGEVRQVGDVDALAARAYRDRPQRIVVADADRPDRSMAEALRAKLDESTRSSVMGVLSLGEAADRLFGLGAMALGRTLVTPERYSRACEVLFERSVDSVPLGLGASIAAALAAGLLSDADDSIRFELELARDINRRHAGARALIPWPEDETLARYDGPRRLAILAHVVQSAADGATEAVPEYVERALAALNGEHGVEALKLRGAIGRALAAAGDYPGAVKALGAALDQWTQLRPAGASYALCELLRIEGILTSEARVLQLRGVAEKLLPELDENSRAYVVLAIGRALAQVGRSRDALDVLEGEGVGPHAAEHVRAAAARWRAYAARALGETARASDALAALERIGYSEQSVLAELDAGPHDVRRTMELLDQLTMIVETGEEGRATLARLAPGLSLRAVAERPELIRRICAEYRY